MLPIKQSCLSGSFLGVICAAVTCLLLVSAAWAQQAPAGRVTAVIGVVDAVSADGETRRLQRGDPVFEGDTLRSGPRGRAQVRFSDRGILSLRPDSELALDSYRDDAASPAASTQQVSLSRGGFRAQTGRIAERNRAGYRVQTPVAAIGIRGTVFDAHQEPGGALLVGATQGGVEVESSTGVSGRIGAGESFNFLRVNPDGTIEFLLEPPDQFTASPDLDETGDDEADESGAGDASESTVGTGIGSAETTAGLDSGGGAELLGVTDDPEASGTIAPAQAGSGLPPTTEPIADPPAVEEPESPILEPPVIEEPEPPVALLADSQIEALLADDRIALVLGVPTATVDEAGSVQVGATELQGGIGTFNSPLLALRGGQQGFGSGIASSERSDLLEQADLFLLPDSGTFTLDEDVGGVPGLVWGVFDIPVTLFLDSADASRTLALNREAIFALGSPTDVPDRSAILSYEQSLFNVFSSGLPVTGVTASGQLNLSDGAFAGLIDLILGADSAEELSLLAEFGAQVNGGVLESIVFGVFDLFDFATETSAPAEGNLAGFFTGDDAAFLQLVFDFRVPSRQDADVLGLILLEQTSEIIIDPLEGLTPEELTSLSQGFAYVGVSCCFEEFGVPSTLYAGVASDPRQSGALDGLLGLQVDGDGNVVGPGMTDFLALPPSLVIRREDAEVDFFRTDFDIPGAESVSAFVWAQNADSLRGFDTATGAPTLDVGEALLTLVGIPTPRANLVGSARYDLAEFVDGLFIDAAGMLVPVLLDGVEMRFLIDFADGQISEGRLRANFDSEDIMSGLMRSGQVLVNFEGQLDAADAFVTFDLVSGSFALQSPFVNDSVDLERSHIGGFFTGDQGEAFAAAFHVLSQGDNDLDDGPVPLLAIGTALLAPLDLSLTAIEAALFGDGLVFVGTDILPGGTSYRGRVTELDQFEAVFGLYLDGNGEPLGVTDENFFAPQPSFLIRRGESSALLQTNFTDAVGIRWTGANAFIVDAETGDVFGDLLGGFAQFLAAAPSEITDLQGIGLTTFGGFAAPGSAASNIGGVPSVRAISFNLDLATGTIHSGHLFVIDANQTQFQNVTGWEAFFTGSLGVSAGNPFVELTLIDGVYRGQDPLDLDASRLEGFFSGANAGPFTQHLNMAYHLRATNPDPNASFMDEPAIAAGVVQVGNRQENRLNAFDVAAWDRLVDDTPLPAFGMAAFSAPDEETPGRGLLLGRGGFRSDNNEFVLGANALATFDEQTGAQIADTRRAEFFVQSFEFVLRRNDGTQVINLDFLDVRPPDGGMLTGFEIDWGRWNTGLGTPRVQTNSFDPGLGVNVGPSVFFANVTPSPLASLPRTGQVEFTYGGPAAFLGAGGGDIAGGRFDIDDFSVSFDLDFASGIISEGFLFASYPGVQESVNWSAQFEGFLNGAITDLSLSSLALSQGTGPPLPLDIGTSNLTGVLTGPAGERHAGAFSFQRDDSLFESVEGLWVIDQLDSLGPQ